MNTENITPEKLRRVAVIGTSCSGKTTFAANLALILNQKHTELDALDWLFGWIARSKDEFLDLVGKEIAKDAWISDGSYTRPRNRLAARDGNRLAQLFFSANLLSFVKPHDAPHLERRRNVFRKPRNLPADVYEPRFDSALGVDQLARKTARIYAAFTQGKPSDKKIFIFRHPQQAKKFLKQAGQMQD